MRKNIAVEVTSRQSTHVIFQLADGRTEPMQRSEHHRPSETKHSLRKRSALRPLGASCSFGR
jgi:hypothetical protein